MGGRVKAVFGTVLDDATAGQLTQEAVSLAGVPYRELWVSTFPMVGLSYAKGKVTVNGTILARMSPEEFRLAVLQEMIASKSTTTLTYYAILTAAVLVTDIGFNAFLAGLNVRFTIFTSSLITAFNFVALKWLLDRFYSGRADVAALRSTRDPAVAISAITKLEEAKAEILHRKPNQLMLARRLNAIRNSAI